jgi:DNA polymerase I-like protein with 3'-5' exonuclease and polymerase domains
VAKAKNKPRVVSDTVQLPLFRPESVWVAPPVATLPTWKGAKRVGIDVETRDDNLDEMGPGVRRGAYICGISFSIEDGPSHYLPIRHAGGDNLPVDQVLAYMKAQAAEYRGDICGGNLSYDLDFLAEEGITFWDCRFRDVMVAEPLLDEWRESYSLENISHKYGYTGKNEELLRMAASAWGWNTSKEVKKNIWRLPARYVGPYGTDDAKLPLLVLRKQERQIESQDIQRIYDLECQVLPVLLKMRRRGVRIDFAKLDEVEAKTLVEQQTQHDIIRAETGIRVGFDDLDKKPLMSAVCDAAGIKLGRTPPSKGHPDGQIKIDKATLESVAKTNKVAAAILEAKVCYKIRNTFVASIRKYATNGRIHCTFNQLRSQRENSDDLFGAAPGRLSCSDPNLQQQPARHPVYGKLWRSIYLPDEGGQWAACDYSQQEPRLLIHYAELSGCPGAKEIADKFRSDLKADMHDETTKLAYPDLVPGTPEFKKARKDKCKIIFLGICYSMGEAKLCLSLGYPTELVMIDGKERRVAGAEGKAFLKSFHEKVPFLADMVKKVQRVAWSRGYIITILGRHCRFPKGEKEERKALNRLIQGSAADQTKLAMVECDRAGVPIQLQVHDELGFTIYSPAEAEKAADIMKNCITLRVPSKVDIEIGPSWGGSM